jgi:hypothetical protein
LASKSAVLGWKPFPEPIVEPSNPDDRSSHLHRMAIGVMGLVLPPLLWLVSWWRPTEGLPRLAPLDSISAYYYTGATAIFVGVLASLAVFLFTYKGYKNKDLKLDVIAAIVAGAAAVGVAFFPTAAPGNLPELSWWTEFMKKIHYASAVVLFCSFSFYSLVLFPKTNIKKKDLPGDKKGRNVIYYLCGGFMVFCMVWAAMSGSRGGPIFWPESLALEAFAVSWLVKGKADKTIKLSGEWVVYHGGHAIRRGGNVLKTFLEK